MSAPFRFQPRVERLRGAMAQEPLSELATRFSSRGVALLEGWPRGTSVLAFDPLCCGAPRAWSELRTLAARLEVRGGDPVPGEFHGGLLGALSYEGLAPRERGFRLPRDPWRLPPAVGGLYCDFLTRVAGRTYLVLGERPGDGRPSVRRRREELLARLATPVQLEPCVARGPLRRLSTRSEHARRIRAVRAAIAAGETYQANLSYRLCASVVGEPLTLYQRLSALHPAEFAGYLRFGSWAILSGSPELLLDFDATRRRALTRPIKGTAPRGSTRRIDRAAARRLLASAKDLSELSMIVDLERNDLGRLAEPGSVRVRGFPRLASYASVHHLMADVVARPRSLVDALACLEALSPGGSVTGAPKLRSMELIAALEGEGRGYAYGSLFSLDTRGDLVANLLIRTLLWRARPRAGPRAGEVTYRVGGGITWGSEPRAELAEAEAKGRRLAQAITGSL